MSVKISGPEKPLGSGDKIDAEDGVNERISRDVWLYLSFFSGVQDLENLVEINA